MKRSSLPGAAWLAARRLGIMLDIPKRRLMPRPKKPSLIGDWMLIALAALCWLAAGVWAFISGHKMEFP